MTELHRMTLSQASAALAAGDTSSVELLDAVLRQAHRIGPTLNAFLRIDADSARAHAVRADNERHAGLVRTPLHGIPLAHKDMFYRAGASSSRGARVAANEPAQRTADVLQRLDNAGAIQFGVLNMAEFAMGPTGHNWIHGHCRNPWDTARITGGSSSGSGAAVAARATFGALGSDTGGSVRLPASLCGVTGLKTTAELVSRAGAMPLSYTMDTIGPLARTAEDCALLLDVIAGNGPDGLPWQPCAPRLNESISGLRIGVPIGYFDDQIDADITGPLAESLKTFAELGCSIIPVQMPELRAINAAGTLINASEAAALHGNWLREQAGDYSEQVRSRIERGFCVPAVQYIDALRYRAIAVREFVDAVFSQVDVLHAPCVAIETPEIDATDVGAGPEMDALMAQLTRLTRPFNYLGLPALSVPCGFSTGGMPIGMQLAGRPFAEDILLRLGQAYQRVTSWHATMPPSERQDGGLATFTT
ncbi:amidase [Paraburkholderia sp. RL18-103-BIB-C]|uniref:amidase n=1 Tax=Paraburkholderia sp. RL18-103-BIB-C TaxID=3031637 RepID=UPI0038B75832